MHLEELRNQVVVYLFDDDIRVAAATNLELDVLFLTNGFREAGVSFGAMFGSYVDAKEYALDLFNDTDAKSVITEMIQGQYSNIAVRTEVVAPTIG